MRKISLLVLVTTLYSKVYASNNYYPYIAKPLRYLKGTKTNMLKNSPSVIEYNPTPNYLSFFYYKDIFIIKILSADLNYDFPENIMKPESFFQTDPKTGEYSPNNDISRNIEKYKHRLNVCVNVKIDELPAVEFVLRKDIEKTEEDKISMNKFIDYLKKLGKDNILMRLVEDGFI